MKWYTRLTRWATRWAWQKEINALDNIAWFKELSLDEHKLQGEVILTDGMAQVIAHAFAEATFNTPNYVEYQFEPRAVRHRDQWAKTVITVKKHTGKTPHELRRIAEQERDDALKQLDELRKELHKSVSDENRR